ncbi:Na+/H+ antiporter [uncultured Chitinophaga sp.]|uniref:Na+/H+ antiporter n=1 Tax=uncultured Chitinophaga sp. TaxID=339340 RepID=UPI0025EB892D|nr:Na+/H+ antiporter [uncultured Chitinophaga sp.]
MQKTFIIYLALVLVILLLVMLAHRLKVAYPIVLVVAGLAIGWLRIVPDITIDPELIFLIFLPPLLYEAAWQTSWKEFWKYRRIISTFAFGIVILTSCVIAWFSSSVIPGFTLALGFLLGGIISPPDAVSATSILRTTPVPKNLAAIIEGESLLNDAASLIVFRFAIIAVATGTFSFQEAATSFASMIVMGILCGLAVAAIFYAIHRWMPTTPSIDTILTIAAPYVMYLTAEQFHYSGVLAVVSGGLFLSNQSQRILNNEGRLQTNNVWATLGFVLNGIVFMLIGLELPVIVAQLGTTSIWDAIRYSIYISIVVIVSRMICAMGASIFTRFATHFITVADPNPGYRAPLVFGWAGMRGVVSLAAALSIPLTINHGQPFPQRNLILFITFSVILITLLFQGLTLPWVVKMADVKAPDNSIPAHEQEAIIRKKLANSSLTLLEEKYKNDVEGSDLLKAYAHHLKNNLQYSEHFTEMLLNGRTDGNIYSAYHRINTEVIDHQRKVLQKINGKEEFDEIIIRKYMLELDLEEEKLKNLFNLNELH